MASHSQKLMLAVLVSSTLAGLLVEFGARAIVSLQVGPSIFLYGLVADRDEMNLASHENIAEGRYSKYFPHQVKSDTDVDTGEAFEVVMNSRGFRGEDFTTEKPAGVTRILTLGASSTFGYHSRDAETYPHRLEQKLNGGCEGRQFEVINLGIPHLDARQIQALFTDEGLPLSPDIVTFYEGVNDSQGGTWRAPKQRSMRQKLRTWGRKHFVTLLMISEAMKVETVFGAADVAREIEEKAPLFLEPLEAIRNLAAEHGASFYVVPQQANSGLYEREEIRGISYAEEVATLEKKLEETGAVGNAERILLIHNALMNGVREWAVRDGVPVIDVIRALDERRDTLVTWVHLTPEGNEIIADAFFDVLAPELCSQ